MLFKSHLGEREKRCVNVHQKKIFCRDCCDDKDGNDDNDDDDGDDDDDEPVSI